MRTSDTYEYLTRSPNAQVSVLELGTTVTMSATKRARFPYLKKNSYNFFFVDNVYNSAEDIFSEITRASEIRVPESVYLNFWLGSNSKTCQVFNMLLKRTYMYIEFSHNRTAILFTCLVSQLQNQRLQCSAHIANNVHMYIYLCFFSSDDINQAQHLTEHQ